MTQVMEVRSSAEDTLRLRLVDRGLMTYTGDDEGLLRWLMSMRLPQEDARSAWEKRLCDRLRKSLA